MKKIKEHILTQAKELFNEKGVADVSYREVARRVGISHSNLIYHFKDKNALLYALHGLMLQRAISLNARIKKEENALKSLFLSTIEGFEVLMDFRFFMIDFNVILRENVELREEILKIESLRSSMYEERINALVDSNRMRGSVYEGEYTDLIEHIRIFSDYWISSAQVYENEMAPSVKKYSRLFLLLFYPYLTDGGKSDFNVLLDEFGL